MDRQGFNNVRLFVGTEVEHSPAFGQRTLFVVGVQPVGEILSAINDAKTFVDPAQHITHVYFGANQSFPRLAVSDVEGWRPWASMMRKVLDTGILCTLDFDVACAESVLETGFSEYANFIPMISVKLPYINQLGYNATLKLDDKDFKATNFGVWCHSLHDLQNREQFTDWSKYTKDMIVK